MGAAAPQEQTVNGQWAHVLETKGEMSNQDSPSGCCIPGAGFARAVLPALCEKFMESRMGAET